MQKGALESRGAAADGEAWRHTTTSSGRRGAAADGGALHNYYCDDFCGLGYSEKLRKAFTTVLASLIFCTRAVDGNSQRTALPTKEMLASLPT